MMHLETKAAKLSLGKKISLNLQELKVSLRNHWMLYLLIIPFVIWYAIFMYKPLYGLQMGFKDYDILTGKLDNDSSSNK